MRVANGVARGTWLVSENAIAINYRRRRVTIILGSVTPLNQLIKPT